MRIKLLGPWNFYEDHAEQYYMIVRYNCSYDVWLVEETGWNSVGLREGTEVHTYGYYPSCRRRLRIKQTSMGLHFRFGDFYDYLLDCSVETTEDGWPNPSWATSCELLRDWLED
jgi:hypothetical protein